MIQKGWIKKKKYLVSLRGIVFLLPMITLPVLASGGTGAKNFLPFIRVENHRVITKYFEAEGNINSNKIINQKPDSGSSGESCCGGYEENGINNFASNKFILEENLLKPLLMFACSVSKRDAVI